MNSKNNKSFFEELNNLLNNNDFLNSLAKELNYVYESIEQAISDIIVYYLNTFDQKFNYSISELLNLSANHQRNRFIFVQVDSETNKRMRLYGFNAFNTKGDIPKDIIKINNSISFSPSSKSDHYVFFSEPIKAMKKPNPQVLFSSILTTPNTRVEDISLEKDEHQYYRSILEERVKTSSSKTGGLIIEGDKIIKKYIDGQRHLVVVDKDNRDLYIVSTKDTAELYSYIPRGKVKVINIPSAYRIKQLCKGNQRTINPTAKVNKPKHIIEYLRLEILPINESFSYFNNDLTGDAMYDINIIYGAKDFNRSKDKISSRFEENLRRIKNSSDIQLTKYGDKYEISNGRHRLVYLKYMYLNRLLEGQDSLYHPQEITIPVFVTHGIEDERFNELLTTLIKENPNIKIVKDNLDDDKPNIIIFIGENVYSVTGTSSLEDFINNKEKYLLIKNKKVHLNYNYIINSLIVEMGPRFFNLSFSTLIKYIKEHGFSYSNQRIINESINIYELYNSFRTIKMNISINQTFNTDYDYLKDVKNELQIFELINTIKNIVYKSSIEGPYELGEVLNTIYQHPLIKPYGEILISKAIKEGQIIPLIKTTCEKDTLKAKR